MFPIHFGYRDHGIVRSRGEIGTVTIAPAAGAVAPTFSNLSGNWFAPDEAGWGYNLIQNAAGQLSGVWMTYRTDCRRSWDMVERGTSCGLWLFMPSGSWIAPTIFRGVVYETTGPSVGTPFDSSKVRANAFGVVTLEFLSATALDFTGDITLEPEGPTVTPGDRQVRKRLVRLDP